MLISIFLLFSALESETIITPPMQNETAESIPQESYPLMATIWTHCYMKSTKAGKFRGMTKHQMIKAFSTAMKPFIE